MIRSENQYRSFIVQLATTSAGLKFLYNLQFFMYAHHIKQSMDQRGKVANPSRGQLNRENDYSPLPVRAREFDLARRVQPSRPAAACSSPYSG